MKTDTSQTAAGSPRRMMFLLLFVGSWLVEQPCARASGVFTYTGSLAAPRFLYPTALLPNGKVLVAGGASSTGGILATAELYDPASGSWTATGSLSKGRYKHTGTLLPNGKVLAAGGFNIFPLASAELFDPASGIWTATGNLGTARYQHTATLLLNGRVLVVGGLDNNSTGLASAELYDPASGTWTATGSLNVARVNHTATLLTSGKVLVAGGSNGGGNASAALYDPATGSWTVTGSLSAARQSHTATLLPNGKVLVAGGSDPGSGTLATAELYDPASGTWTATGSLATARTLPTATLLSDGQVLVAGGVGKNGIGLASAELYDPSSGTWTATGSLNVARAVPTATLLSDGQVLVATGNDANGSPLASAELYRGTPSTPAQLLNISTRMRVLTNDNVLIGGFIITGTDPKKVIIRGIGPSLSVNGAPIPGRLADPTLELHQPDGTVIINDNWKINDQTGQSQEADIRATTIPPTNDLESAIIATLPPGNYTAILAGKNGGVGVGLVEVYDLAQAANSRLANISSRGFVDTGDNVMIGGLIVGGGTGSAKVIVRAIGPSLTVNGTPVPGRLADPTLELHNASGTMIVTNDNWKINDQTGQSQEADIRATTVPPTNDLESAIVATLPPDNYTAIVRGKNDTIGIAVVEAYNLQ